MDWLNPNKCPLVFTLEEEVISLNNIPDRGIYTLSNLDLPNFKVKVLINQTYSFTLELLKVLRGSSLYGGLEEQLHNYRGNYRISLVKEERDPYKEGLFYFFNGDIFNLSFYKEGVCIDIDLDENKSLYILQFFLYEVMDRALKLGLVNQYERNYYNFKELFAWEDELLYKEFILNVSERKLSDTDIYSYRDSISDILKLNRYCNVKSCIPIYIQKALAKCRDYHLGKDIDKSLYLQTQSIYQEYFKEQYLNLLFISNFCEILYNNYLDNAEIPSYKETIQLLHDFNPQEIHQYADLFFNKFKHIALEFKWKVEDYQFFCQNLYNKYIYGWTIPSDEDITQRMYTITPYLNFCNNGIGKPLHPLLHQKAQTLYGQSMQYINNLSDLKTALLLLNNYPELLCWLDAIDEIMVV